MLDWLSCSEVSSLNMCVFFLINSPHKLHDVFILWSRKPKLRDYFPKLTWYNLNCFLKTTVYRTLWKQRGPCPEHKCFWGLMENIHTAPSPSIFPPFFPYNWATLSNNPELSHIFHYHSSSSLPTVLNNTWNKAAKGFEPLIWIEMGLFLGLVYWAWNITSLKKQWRRICAIAYWLTSSPCTC